MHFTFVTVHRRDQPTDCPPMSAHGDSLRSIFATLEFAKGTALRSATSCTLLFQPTIVKLQGTFIYHRRRKLTNIGGGWGCTEVSVEVTEDWASVDSVTGSPTTGSTSIVWGEGASAPQPCRYRRLCLWFISIPLF